jgi:hypothetical protein
MKRRGPKMISINPAGPAEIMVLAGTQEIKHLMILKLNKD